jgi:D-threo-aldose 1-dehydrogenase
MHTIQLANGSRSSLLVFGCGGLGGANGSRQATKLLSAAWDAGIRHFDVAPSYAFGEAEVMLGRALRQFGVEARVTTKVGIGSGPRPGAAKLLLTDMARWVLAATPGMRKRLGRLRAASLPRGQFGIDSVRTSVEASLRALGRDHIDILLLHEATAEDLSPDLMFELDRMRVEGKIGEAGIGSRDTTVSRLSFPLPAALSCVQTEWRFGNDGVPPPPGLRVNRHGVMRNLAPLRTLLADNPTLIERIEALTGRSCRTDRDLTDLVMGLARHEAPGGQIVVQSSRPERVQLLNPGQDLPRVAEVLSLLRSMT